MKYFYHFLLIISSIGLNDLQAQPFIFKSRANQIVYYNNLSKQNALKYRIRSKTGYKKYVNKKDSLFIFNEEYDTLGNLKSKIDYHYNRDKDYELFNFSFDSISRIKESYSTVSFIKDHIFNYYKYHYNENSEISLIEAGSGSPSDLHFRSYQYDKTPVDSTKFCQYDSVGRITKIEDSLRSMREEFKYKDGKLAEIIFINESTQYIQKGIYNDKKQLIEEINYHNGNKFMSRFTYEYYENGLRKKDYVYNKKGKVKYIKVYSYTFY